MGVLEGRANWAALYVFLYVVVHVNPVVVSLDQLFGFANAGVSSHDCIVVCRSDSSLYFLISQDNDALIFQCESCFLSPA